LLAHRLLPIRQALTQIHAPASMADLQQARYRLIYQELLVLQLALALRRQQHDQRCHAPPLPATARIDARIRRLFPFELTAAQNQALAEITADMAQTRPMNRLLQGDVGSGKTVVAEYAMLLTVAHGYQAAMMAPTEMLARQHAGTLARDLQHSKVRIALLTGGLSAAERRAALERITADEVDLIVGTHALLQEDLALPKLGLVVIDEQHKFGVRQRAALRGAGTDPHYLVMTATPIPRTVSMTLFGDLDISTLREAPPGRPQVHTYLAEPGQRAKWWEFVRKKLAEGRQAYVIAPLVSGSDEEDVAGAEQIFQALQAGELAGHRLDLVHGRVSPGQREQIMQAFRDGRTQVLVATSVLEVGIDVPNATLLTIEGGERFGLAQLHQMRGRVSRGLYPGYVCVFADATRDESRRRLEAFRQSRDGFQLAETDFQLRGPGDLFGTRQHGLPPFHIADPLRDQEILEVARREARELAGPQGRLDQPEFARLRRMVVRRYGQALDLADAG
jgi:ATP-dependent DNA helicase RecG